MILKIGLATDPTIYVSNGAPNWTAIGSAVGTMVIAVGVSFAALQYRTARAARSSQIVADLVREVNGPDAVKVRSLLLRLRIQIQNEGLDMKSDAGRDRRTAELVKTHHERAEAGSADYFEIPAFLNFFETMGITAKADRQAFRLIETTLGPNVVEQWSIWEPFLNDISPGVPSGDQPFANFRNLADKIDRRERRKGSRMRDFLGIDSAEIVLGRTDV